MDPIKTRVFISYAKEDKEIAEKLYGDLEKSGVKPWIDSLDLLPGQRWEVAIRKAINESDYFLALLSTRSVGKKGYVQKEIRHALEIANSYPDDEIYIIPLLIDKCEPSFEGLRDLQWENLFPYEKCLNNLLLAFNYEAEKKHATTKIERRKRHGRIHRIRDMGFGFLLSVENEELFFHSNSLIGVSFDELQEGDDVLFWISESDRGPFATQVERA